MLIIRCMKCGTTTEANASVVKIDQIIKLLCARCAKTTKHMVEATLKPVASKWLQSALAAHAGDVQRGCTCLPPSQSGTMKFKPRSVGCPLHGERAVS